MAYPNFTKHVHEFLGSTKLKESHTHRFAGVTSEGVLISNGTHRHRFSVNTDFYEDHHHRIFGTTGININVGNGRHIHFVVLRTTINDNHTHVYRLGTLIDNPSGME